MLRLLTVLAAASGIAATASMAGAAPSSPAGGRCGGFIGIRCDPGLTCRRPAGGADRMGICIPAGPTQACTRIYQPVCGRDGRTYPNACVMRSIRVPMLHPGRC